MRRIKLILPVTLFLILNSEVIHGCSCRTPTIAQALRRSKTVFAGQVVAVVNRRATFKVERAWKGVSADTITMFMGGSVISYSRKRKEHIELAATSCDFDFVKGERYLVYASDEGGFLRAWVCSRTQKLENAEQDLRDLGEGEIPKSVKTIH